MISFPVLLTLFIPVLILYLDIYINFKKEIDDIKIKGKLSSEDTKRIRNRKNKLIFLSIITITILLIMIALYKLPPKFFNNIKPLAISDLFPFKEGFFQNENFAFSYITELILVIITLIIWVVVLIDSYDPYFIKSKDYILVCIYTLLFVYVTIWINYYISNFLVDCIIRSFAFLSIIFNVISYIVIDLISFFIIYIIDGLFE